MSLTGPITGTIAGTVALMAASLLPGTAAQVANAADTAFVITGSDLRVHQSATDLRVNPQPGFTQIGYPQREAVGIIYKPVLVDAAAVDEAVARTPALPHLIRLQVGQTTTLVDPQANYRGEHPGGLDHNHSIIRAQRTAEALRSGGVRVIRRPAAPADQHETLSVENIRPRAILLRPNVTDQPAPHQEKRDVMPTIPRPQESLEHQKMAAAR